MGKKRGRQPAAFSDQIRQHVKACGLSRYRLWKLTGISEPSLSRFVHGECGLGLEALDRLAEVLRLEVTMKGPDEASIKGAK